MLPALQSAVAELDSLNKADIIEMRTFIKPPALVQLTMEGVCILLQVHHCCQLLAQAEIPTVHLAGCACGSCVGSSSRSNRDVLVGSVCRRRPTGMLPSV